MNRSGSDSNYNSRSDSDSDSDSNSESSSSSESEESEFEDDYGSDQERFCEITNDIIMPKLSVSCLNQNKPNGKKCFKNKCLEVSKLISISNETSSFGNIVQVKDDNDETYIVKWNRFRNDISEFKYEVRIQQIAYSLGLGPKILQVYEQKSQVSSGGYIYIFMTDLIKLGYKSISEYFGLFNKQKKQIGWRKIKKEQYDGIPKLIIIEIAKTLKKLHSVGIAHRDLHPGNVFTNGSKIMLIDFGLSKKYNNSKDAWSYEKFSNNRKFWSDLYTNEQMIPSNWEEIKNLSKPY